MSSKSKKAAEAVKVPQNGEQAAEFLAALGWEQRFVAGVQSDIDDKLAKLKAEAEALVKPSKERITALTRGLEIWASANREALTQGGRSKTILLGTGTLSWRLAPPSVRIADAAKLLAALAEKGLGRFIRTKHEPNKEALLAEAELAATLPGVTVASAGEAFVAEPATAPLAPVREG